MIEFPNSSTTVTRNLALAIAAFVLCLSALATTASAATEVGSRCAASGGQPSRAVVSTTAASAVFPTDGVITKWGTGFLPTDPLVYPVSQLTLRGAGTAWTITGSSITEVAKGPSEYAARISVTAGDRIGMGNTTVYCAAVGENMALGAYAGEPVGTLLDLSLPGPNLMPAIWATLEPDVDKDGFGDETQDLCPQGADFQTACPVPVLAVFRVPSASGFKAIATTSIATTVVLNGSFKTRASKGKRSRTVKFKSKKFKTSPGKITSVSLKWPRSLNQALDALDSRSKLLVKVSVTADGLVTDRIKTFKIRLNGRG